MTEYQRSQVRVDLPRRSTPDSVAEHVAALLSAPRVRVERLTIESGRGSEPSHILVDMHAEVAEPPHGTIPEMPPADLWQALSGLELLTQLPEDVSHGLRTEPLRTVVGTMMQAAELGQVPLGWATGSASLFARWIGLPTEQPPASFMALPLVESHAVGDDRLVLLCARSGRHSMIQATNGYVVVMDTEE